MKDMYQEKGSEIHTVNIYYVVYAIIICKIHAAQFKVHIRPSGKIALQNAANPDSWLGIFEGRTLGSVSHFGESSETLYPNFTGKWRTLFGVLSQRNWYTH